MEDKIAGHKIPKYQIPKEDLETLIFNMENSKSSEQVLAREEANKTRSLAGLCNSCRLSNCLCHEGQR